MFSLEPHVLFHETTRKAWSELLGTDEAYLNAVVYSLQFYYGLIAGVEPASLKPSRSSYKHLDRSLQLLRVRLSDKDETKRLSDSTLMIILALTAQSSMLGQNQITRGHLKGLKKIVELRGGMANLRSTPKLLLEVFR